MSEPKEQPVTASSVPAEVQGSPVRTPSPVTTLGAFLMVVIGCAMTAALMFLVMERQGGAGAAASGIISVDTAGIISARLLEINKEVAAAGGDERVFEEKSREAIMRLKVVLDDYSKKGYIVINENAVMSAPEGINHTNEVGQKIGLQSAISSGGRVQ